MRSFTSDKNRISKEIQASPQRLFAVLTNYEAYPASIPEIQEIEQQPVDGHEKHLALRLKVWGMELPVTLTLQEEPFYRVGWNLQKGRFLSNWSGEFRIEPLERERLRLSVRQKVALKGPIPAFLSTFLADTLMRQRLDVFKYKAEQSF